MPPLNQAVFAMRRVYLLPALAIAFVTAASAQTVILKQNDRLVTPAGAELIRISLGINMRSGQQIDLFGKHVQEKLDGIKHYLPDDLVIVPTSSQPVQVKEQIDLFMDALYEAIGLVVIVSLVGFWEWRSALLMALSIPITLAMTFGFAHFRLAAFA